MPVSLVLALALLAQGDSKTDAPIATAAPPAPAAAPAQPVDPDMVIPSGAPKDDYRFVAWCHGALAGQMELDPIVTKDMDAIEGPEKSKERHKGDAEITAERKTYLALYEKALAAAEKASPNNIHQSGVDAELQGYRIWGPTKNKAPVWRMVDWGNWEVPPRCQIVAKRLFEHASLFGDAMRANPDTEAAEPTPTPTPAPPAPAPKADEKPAGPPPAAVTPPEAAAATPQAATDAAPPVVKPAAKTPPAKSAAKKKAATGKKKSFPVKVAPLPAPTVSPDEPVAADTKPAEPPAEAPPH